MFGHWPTSLAECDRTTKQRRSYDVTMRKLSTSHAHHDRQYAAYVADSKTYLTGMLGRLMSSRRSAQKLICSQQALKLELWSISM
jgi:hypothetical protein